ncbi:MAG TPA: FAD-binding oxidoreductase [Gemmatimonadales bacterium]|nr:FAD-binding oxidoreductase [Gemmatimonadales bacterium]
MRRWNGWGDEATEYPVPPGAARLLEQRLGPGAATAPAPLSAVLAAVPRSRLPAHALIDASPEIRVRHARGQSLPDWVATRSGRLGVIPDAVALPNAREDVRTLLDYGARTGARLIPYGGGTSVVGHVNPLGGEAPVLTVSLARINGLRRFDEVSELASFGAGIAGPDLEAQLRARGFTLGHFPQSFEFSTLGGWIATRSSGQQSLGYGRIERLFAGGRVEAPAGTLDLPSFPASAAGPDLREIVLGCEGRLGIITEATVRVSPLPERERFYAVFLPTFDDGVAAVRELVQARLPLSMLRLSTAVETETTLRLAGHERLIQALEGVLSLRGAGAEKCMLLLGFTGRKSVVTVARKDAIGIALAHRGVRVGGAVVGKQWQRSRFRVPYLRNALWEAGYAVDTLETATRWSRVPKLVQALEAALEGGLAPLGERVHAFTHLSHFYPDGASLYATYLFRLAADPDETLDRWRTLKAAASAAIVAHRATISHHHGVGLDNAPWLAAEKGVLGMQVLRDVWARFDPAGMMNPGKLL